jgi:putative nucleotidyltransferase with HDIG domain
MGIIDAVLPSKQENVFELVLDFKYPLMQEFRERCPGSFKHSQSLASITEAVSLALNLNVDFMKVAAQYHDIGKIFNSKFFSENQLEGENPHDELDPKISYEIITRHVSDSVMVLINDHNFSRELIEVISQHHGTTVLRYFFNKFGGAAEESHYRYKCARPQSVESMVLMVCDQVEATSKSLVQAGKFNPTDVIERTLSGLLNDGQFDAVHIKLGDVKKIKLTLAKELEGLYQKRVDYNGDEDTKVSTKEDQSL